MQGSPQITCIHFEHYVYKDFCDMFEIQNVIVDSPNLGKDHTAWFCLSGWLQMSQSFP